MSHRHPVIWGTVTLTAAGLISRFIGFFYRIFLSHAIGAEGVGIYQLIFPVYTLCFALTVFGMQAAISRFAAAEFALGSTQRADDVFLLGTGVSLLLSCLTALFLYRHAQWIGCGLLAEPRTVPLLMLLSFSIPLGCLHNCINAWYYARRETAVPALSQMLEQAVRVGVSVLVCKILLSRGAPVNALVAVAGILGGELAAMLFSTLMISWKLHTQNYRLSAMRNPSGTLGKLFRHSFPLTCNRVLLTLMSSVENIMIPIQLRLYGLSGSDALSLFGVLTGMSLPLLLFPSTVTNSVSVMLLPSVAEKQALGESRRIRDTISATVRGCLLLGGVCFLLFFFLGRFLGMLIYHSESAGLFLRTLSFICPFLYLNSTLVSILNGLGRTTRCLVHNLISVGIRILFVLFCIPVYGIKGYLWGMLLGELTLTVLNLTALFSILLKEES